MLEENWGAVQVFTRCRQEYATSIVGGPMTGLGSKHFALGFKACEVESALRLAGIPVDEWPEVSEHVLHMGGIAATALNQRQGT